MVKDLKLPDSISAELAYLCGVLIGDGCIWNREEKHDYLIKCVGNPKDEKEFFNQVIGPLFKRVFNFTPKMRELDSKTTFGFTIYSKVLYNYLTKELGMFHNKKDFSLHIPTIFKKDKQVLINLIRGLFDTDGCICFKKRYRKEPYYPVISFSSLSKRLALEIAKVLKSEGFKIVETYDYKTSDVRAKAGFTQINRLELNGYDNLRRWMATIGFYNPKNLSKIKKIAGGGFEFGSSKARP